MTLQAQQLSIAGTIGQFGQFRQKNSCIWPPSPSSSPVGLQSAPCTSRSNSSHLHARLDKDSKSCCSSLGVQRSFPSTVSMVSRCSISRPHEQVGTHQL